VPAVIVTCPAATAVNIGGLSADRLTTEGSLDFHVSPVTDCPAALSAWMVWVSPTTMFSRLGASVLPPGAGTLKPSALLHTPPLVWSRAMPLTAPEATQAVTCVSVHCRTWAAMLPSQATPCAAPKPEPVNVTRAPARPEVGLTEAIRGVPMENWTALLAVPFCSTWAKPEAAPAPTWATIWPSLQLCTTPAAVPSHTWPLPCVEPKPEPAMVTESPGAPMGGATLEITGAITVKGTELDQAPPCCTWAFPLKALGATVATICVALQFATVAGVEPSQTVPGVSAKFEPEMVTCAPGVAAAGETLAIDGTGITANPTGLLAKPPTVTTNGPVVAPLGTFTVMLLSLQGVVEPALTPLNVTVLLPCDGPKLLPAMVTMEPTAAKAGFTLATTGGGLTVKFTGLLANPRMVTATGPLVAPPGRRPETLDRSEVAARRDHSRDNSFLNFEQKYVQQAFRSASFRSKKLETP